MALPLGFVVVTLLLFLDVAFVVKPVRRFGLLNVVLGLFTLLFCVYFGMYETVDGLTVGLKWYFSSFVGVAGVLCLLRGLYAGGLYE